MLIGALVLALAGAFLYYLLQDESLSAGGNDYYLRASFSSAQGISVGSDVRMAGVRIGNVSGMTLNKETYLAELDLAIQSDILIPTDSAAIVGVEGLLGGYYVEIEPGGEFDYYEAGDRITDTEGHVSLINLLSESFFAQ